MRLWQFQLFCRGFPKADRLFAKGIYKQNDTGYEIIVHLYKLSCFDLSAFRSVFSLAQVKSPCLADFAIEMPHCYALFAPLNVAVDSGSGKAPN